MLGPLELIGDDSCIFYHGIAAPDSLFALLKDEVEWQTMMHAAGPVPRLVCAQGQLLRDGSKPVYRHPSDQSLPLRSFSPIVNAIRREVEVLLKQDMNHVLIQLYRSGADHITEHSDKTLDILRGSDIANVSIGAQRTMRLREKKSSAAARQTSSGIDQDEPSFGRMTLLVPLPHGSVFVLGPQTNARWLHGIKQDKRAENEKLAEELAHGGQRISLTFRLIATYLNADETLIWGQGATGKNQDAGNEAINGDSAETERLLRLFGAENQESDSFAWDAVMVPARTYYTSYSAGLS